MKYVDGFVLPVPKKNIEAYLKMSRRIGKIWMEHGALEYRECVGEDLKVKGLVQFPALLKSKPNETVVFAWIVFKSRKHRDSVNKKVMADPRISPDNFPMVFDCKRMAYGGFQVGVELSAK